MSRLSFDPTPVLARFDLEATNSEIAEILGVSRETVQRWRNGRAGIDPNLADKLAVHRLGVHPATLWPDSWWAAA